MLEFLIVLTVLILMVGVIAAFHASGDVLHPLMLLGPLFLLSTGVEPWLVRGELVRFFPNPEDVNIVLALYLFAVTGFVLGALHYEFRSASRTTGGRGRRLSEREKTVLLRLAAGLAAWALVSYSYGIANAGGFETAFSRSKGGGFSTSGYLSEGMNLSLVAAVMVALARYRQGWTPGTLTLLLLGLLPNLVQGTFGGRRGPMFLALAAAMLSSFIARRAAPKIWLVWPSLGAAVLAVVFVGSQRQSLHLGSGEGVSWEGFAEALVQSDVDVGNNFIYGAGLVLATHHAGEFTWGRKLAVNLLVRPIPRQFWPTKYEDAGATWVTSDYPGLGHVTRADWLGSVGWLPLPGSSAISIADLFGEFGWGAAFVFYLVGRGFAELNRRRRMLGGMWQLLYFEALILSIYLATQSFSAFYHRYLILAVPTVIAWRLFVERRSIPAWRRVIRRPAAMGQAVR